MFIFSRPKNPTRMTNKNASSATKSPPLLTNPFMSPKSRMCTETFGFTVPAGMKGVAEAAPVNRERSYSNCHFCLPATHEVGRDFFFFSEQC